MTPESVDRIASALARANGAMARYIRARDPELGYVPAADRAMMELSARTELAALAAAIEEEGVL